MSNKRILMIAGPNGAGKTTFAENFLLHEANCPAFVNADAIAAGLSPFQPHTMAIKAGKLMMSQIQEYAAKGVSFAFETTLSGRGYARMIPEWQAKGFKVKLIFLWLPDVVMAISRVKRRVRDGGHWVDDDTIIRRYHAGLANLERLYKPLVDWWALYDSSKQTPTMIENAKADTDEDIENALIALRRAAKKVHEGARLNGDSVIIYKDGRVVEWFPATDTCCKAVKPEASEFHFNTQRSEHGHR